MPRHPHSPGAVTLQGLLALVAGGIDRLVRHLLAVTEPQDPLIRRVTSQCITPVKLRGWRREIAYDVTVINI